MNGLGRRPGGKWIGIVALVWIVILTIAWLVASGGVPLPRWRSIGPAAVELSLLLFTLGAAYGWGRLALLRWHTPPDGRPNPYFAFGLGFGILWLATLVVAALRLLVPAWPWLLLGGGWVALVATLRPLPRLRLPDVTSWGITEWFLLLVMLCSTAYSLLAWALVPPLAWDEVSYHLPIAQRFIQAGGHVSIPDIVHSNWPSGMEMLNALALLMGSERLPHLIVTVMSVLTALALGSFARRRLDRRTGWLAAALYLSMPVVKYLSGVALIEGALGYFGFLAVWSGYVWLESRSWRDLILAAALGGLVASIKLTGAWIPAAIAAVSVVWLGLRHRGFQKRSVMQLIGYALISMLVVAPWYIRSALNTGNPVWPFMYELFGGREWDAVGDQLHMTWLRQPNMAPSLWNYLSGPWHLTVSPDRFGGLGMGLAILALAPLSALFLNRRRWLLAYLIAVGIVVYSLWFAATHQTRFLMGIVPLLALLSAYAFYRLLEIWPASLTALAQIAMMLYLVLGLPFLNMDQRTRIHDGWAYIGGHWSRDEFLERRVDGFPAFQFANDNLPDGATVLLGPFDTRSFYLQRATIWASPISQRVIKWEQLSNAEQAVQAMAALGITHVFWNDNVTVEGVEDQDHMDWLLGELLDRYGKPIYGRNGFAVYELQIAR